MQVLARSIGPYVSCGRPTDVFRMTCQEVRGLRWVCVFRGVIFAEVVSAQYSLSLQEASVLAANPGLQTTAYLERPTVLDAEGVEKVKAVWRSEEARALLAAQAKLGGLYPVYQAVLVLTGTKEEQDKVAAEHSERMRDVDATAGLMALCQAAYKTLRNGENRKELVTAVVNGLQAQQVALSDAVNTHVTKIISG